MKTSTICLWFDGNAQAAVNFYLSIFKEGKIIQKLFSDVAPPTSHKDEPLTIEFELLGVRYLALNGGPMYQHSPAISIMLNCDSQQEIDYFWEKLPSDGGSTNNCGWLTDRFGISWQVCPAAFSSWLGSKEPGKANRVMKAMMQMQKLDIETLKNA